MKTSRAERLLQAYNLYKEKGTLEAVGRQIGVTRERVRQLLVQGTKLGLFEYKPFEYPYIPKEKIIEDYKRLRSLKAIAKVNDISTTYLQKLLTAYNITEKDLHSLRIEGSKLHCINQYNRIKNEIGHHPTTTELQHSKPWRYLALKIAKLWGSFDAFRGELDIPKPPQGSRSFSEDTRKYREHKQRLAFIKRMQHLERIREFLNLSGSLALSQISYECGLSLQRTYFLLRLLIANKEVIKEGGGAHIKYRLQKEGDE